MISRDEAETLLKTDEVMFTPGSFLLRFANSRIWPHPDAGALVVSYVGNDKCIYHKLLTLDAEYGTGYVHLMHSSAIFVVCISHLCCPICIQEAVRKQLVNEVFS